jgi:aryl-alcohol dehydrogenase-like predicted oxidoreductase
MEYRALGRSGLRISMPTTGTMTFGGEGDFTSVGSTGVDEARRQVDQYPDAEVNAARELMKALIPAALDQGLGVLTWSPPAGGLLSGRYRRDRQAPVGSRQLTDWNGLSLYDQGKLYDTVEVLVEAGQAHGVSAAQVAVPTFQRR